MIIDHIEQLLSYRDFLPDLVHIHSFLHEGDILMRDPGRYCLRGDDFFAIIEDCQGKGLSGAKLETHNRYLDLQICLRGEDLMGWRSKNTCTQILSPYQEKRDIALYNDLPDLWVPLRPTQFAIVAPHDAHAPLGGEGTLRKLIFKIPISSLACI